MKSYNEISIRYMKQNKKRTTLTIIGITLATILIFAVGTFLLSFRDSMIAEEKSRNGDYEFILNKLDNDQVDKVINNAEVKDSSIQEDGGTFIVKGTDRMLSITKGNKDYFDKLFVEKIIEGKKPSSECEIVIDKSVKNILNLNLNDDVVLVNEKGDEHKVKLVGISEINGYSDNILLAKEYFSAEQLDNSKNHYVSVNLKSKKDKNTIIKKVADNAGIELREGVLQSNKQVLYFTGNGENEAISKSLQSITIFVIAIIMICTTTVIYNSFNISIIERMKYFGILKAIGSTPKQIKKIVYKEGLIMGIIALPLGCILGYLSLVFGIKLFIGNTLVFMENFKIQFYPIIILITVILVAITIFLSIIGPARKAKKVSAIDAMRNKNEIRLGKLKRRRGKLVNKIFGIEGNIAYKNIRRTPFRFVVTVLALTISIIMFNVFYGFMDFAKQSMSQQFMHTSFDSQVNKVAENSGFTNEEIDELTEKPFVREYYKFKNDSLRILLPSEEINMNYSEETGLNCNPIVYDDINYTEIPFVTTLASPDNGVKLNERNIVEGKLDMDAIKNGGIILIDGYKTTDRGGQVKIVRMTKYKVGDKIRIPKAKNYTKNYTEDPKGDISELKKEQENEYRDSINKGDYYELPIVAIVNKEPLMSQYPQGIGLIFHEDAYSKFINKSNYDSLLYSFNDDTTAREEAIEYFDSISSQNEYRYMDMGDALKQVNQLYEQMEFFVYCFITIVTIISIVNIFNTISTNLLLRKKEFSTMKAIGMTEKQLKKSVMLEGTLYGILAAIIGGIISALLLVLLVNLGGALGDVEYKFNFIAFLGSIICAIAVTYISTLAPLKNLKKLTIVEGISDEE